MIILIWNDYEKVTESRAITSAETICRGLFTSLESLAFANSRARITFTHMKTAIITGIMMIAIVQQGLSCRQINLLHGYASLSKLPHIFYSYLPEGVTRYQSFGYKLYGMKFSWQSLDRCGMVKRRCICNVIFCKQLKTNNINNKITIPWKIKQLLWLCRFWCWSNQSQLTDLLVVQPTVHVCIDLLRISNYSLRLHLVLVNF